MDNIFSTALQLFIYVIYILLLSALAICHDPLKRNNNGLLGLAFGAATIGALSSAVSLADHHFASLPEFWTWLGQSTEPVYGGKPVVRQVGYAWNGMVCLYILAPAVVFVVRTFGRAYLKRKPSP